jgi:hypothetical protein
MKNSNYLIASFAAFALFHSTANAVAECMATLKDPHGSVVVPCNGGTKATLKGGEHFLADPRPDGWDVYLKSGCHGFIGKAKLQLLPNEPLMKLNFDQERKLWLKKQSARSDQLGEAGVAFEWRGLNYFKILTAASKGDQNAMALFYSVCEKMDAAAAEDCFWRGWALLHVVGDETFAKFLSGQLAEMRKRIAEILSSGDQDPISKPKPYIKRYFPKSYNLLFATKVASTLELKVMPKPMTEEQRARWARWRAMGRTRFMLMGILLYGVPWFLLMLILEYFEGGTLWHHRTLTVSFLIVLSAPVGVSIGGLHWRNQERRFAEATAASS